MPNRRLYSYRDHEEVYDSAPKHSLPQKPRRSHKQSRSGSSTSRRSTNRTVSQTVFDDEESNTRPPHSLRVTLAGAIVGGLLGR